MTGNPWRRLPVAVAVLAIAAMAVADRRVGPLDAGSATGLWDKLRPLGALAAVVLLVVVATNFAKHRDDGFGPLHRAGTATAVLLTAAALLTPIGLLLIGRKPAPPPPDPQVPVQPGKSGLLTQPSGDLLNPGGGTSKPISDWIGEWLLYIVLAAALGLVVYVLVRLLAGRRFRRLPMEVVDFEPMAPEFAQLAEAVAAGTEALEYEGDAREAVIACYSAMELAVSAGGGGGRRTTDTPEEFLRRITAARLIPQEPARELTDLFREARFSSHRIGEEKRDAAREALRTISEHLRIRSEESAAANASAATASTPDTEGVR